MLFSLLPGQVVGRYSLLLAAMVESQPGCLVRDWCLPDWPQSQVGLWASPGTRGLFPCYHAG